MSLNRPIVSLLFFLNLFSLPVLAESMAGTMSGSMNDQQFLHELRVGGLEEVLLGKLAQRKAQDAGVKDFGARMVMDHTRLDEQVKVLAAQEGIELSSTSEVPNQASLRELEQFSGVEFDRHYIEKMLEDHQKDIAQLQEYLDSAEHLELRNLIKKSIPILENHIRMAEHLAGKLGVSPLKGLNQPEHPE